MEELAVTMIDPYTLAIHPDGRDIIVSSVGLSVPYPEYWVMENFLPDDNNK
jgi:hypothetical protein